MQFTKLNDFATRYTAAWCSQNAANVASFFSPAGSLQIRRKSDSWRRAVLGRVLPVGYGTASEGTRWRRIGSEGRHPATSCRWQQKNIASRAAGVPKDRPVAPKKTIALRMAAPPSSRSSPPRNTITLLIDFVSPRIAGTLRLTGKFYYSPE